MSNVDPPAPIHWRKLHAFGLPEGSVRAILALLIFSTIWGWLWISPDKEIPDYLRDLLFIILGHYFALRNRPEPNESIGPPPLFLPRGTVRLLLIAGFVVVGAMLYRRDGLPSIERSPGFVTLLLVGGFLLGVVLRKISNWWRHQGHRTPRIVEDLRASVAILAAVLLVLFVWSRLYPVMPTLREGNAIGDRLRALKGENLLAAFIGFYFGSRS